MSQAQPQPQPQPQPQTISGAVALQITEATLIDLMKFWASHGHHTYRRINMTVLAEARHLVVEHFERLKRRDLTFRLPPADPYLEASYRCEEARLQREALENRLTAYCSPAGSG